MKALLLIFALTCSVSAGQLDSRNPVAAGMWHFNDNYGAVAKNELPNGGFSLTSVAWVSGKMGSAINCTSTASRIIASPNTAFNSTTYMTTVFWFRWSAQLSDYETIISKRMGATSNYEIGLDISSKQIYIWSGGGLGVFPFLPKKNIWYHFAMVIGPTSSKLYIDGKHIGTVSIGIGAANVGSLYLCNMGSGQYFIGSIDDVALYPADIPRERIQRIYIESLGRHSNAR